MPVFSIDFETRSAVDLKKAGAHLYATDRSTDVMCMAWRQDAGPVQLWRGGILEPEADPFPPEILAHIERGGVILAHNAAFEYKIWNGPLRRRFPHLPPMPVERWYCTMAAALAAGLPAGLDALAGALRVSYRKDLEGSRALMRLCKPKLVTEDGTVIWDTDAGRRDLVYRYCKQDVEVERAVGAKLPLLSSAERKVWIMDQRINDRGVAVDREFCEQAIPLLDLAKRDADRAVSRLTHGKVTAVSQTKRLVEWISDQGVACTSVAKGEVEDLKIEADLMGYPQIREVLEIKQDANKSSTAKYRAFLACTGADGRVRGLLQYHGAATGRWAGRLVQPQNFPKIDWETEAALVDTAFDVVPRADMTAAAKIASLSLIAGVSPFKALSKALRPVFIAGPGKKLVGGDWSNIEGRINAWLAGETWKLRAFAEYDRGTGPDLYKVTAANILGKRPEQITKVERQNYGKVPELACIAEDQRVLVLRAGGARWVRISKVLCSDLVWDGVEWVAHEGVVPKGERVCIHYDGITATEDHLVWIEGPPGPVSFGHAAASRARLKRSVPAGAPPRLGRDNRAAAPIHAGLGHGLRGYSLHRLWKRRMASLGELNVRSQQGLPSVQSTAPSAAVAGPKSYGHAAALHEHQRCRLPELRWAGDRISFRIRHRSVPVDSGQSRLARGHGIGPHKQRRPLRTGKPPVGYADHAEPQQTNLPRRRRGLHLGPVAQSVCVEHDETAANIRGVARRDGGTRQTGGSRKAKRLARTSRTVGVVRVYDILNAGPRNRFCVEGRIVHNCGFQGGVNALNTWTTLYNIKLEREEQAKEIVDGWREANGNIKRNWYSVQDAAVSAVKYPGKVATCCGGRVSYYMDGPEWLVCRLPSGRTLRYRTPYLEKRMTPWGEERDTLFAWGMNGLTKQWEPYSLYGGILVENLCQAISACILRLAMTACEAQGKPVVLTVHDEIVVEVDADDPFGKHDLSAIMLESDPWMAGLPMAADCWEGIRYGK